MSSSKSIPLEETYKALLKLSSPHEKAIAKDLSRTFPNHKFFQEGGGVGQESLFMVVKAYSLYVVPLRAVLKLISRRYDQEVGYTQGLAFIVAALLLNVRSLGLARILSQLNADYCLGARRGSLLRSRPLDGLVQPTIPLSRRYARSATPPLPV